jgi:hypothetical protein
MILLNGQYAASLLFVNTLQGNAVDGRETKAGRTNMKGTDVIKEKKTC